jgi:hypothetical protein
MFAHKMHTITRIIWFRASDRAISTASGTVIQLDVTQCSYSRDDVIWHAQSRLTPQHDE